MACDTATNDHKSQRVKDGPPHHAGCYLRSIFSQYLIYHNLRDLSAANLEIVMATMHLHGCDEACMPCPVGLNVYLHKDVRRDCRPCAPIMMSIYERHDMNAVCADVSPMLLNLSTIDDNTYLFGRVHDGFWDALSESLVKLSIEMHAPYVFRQDDIARRWMSVFNKLTDLTSLKVCGSIWYDTTCVLDLPRLKNLHISQLSTSKLTLKCPVLRSLTLQRCTITGPFSLDAPLEHLACEGNVNICVHEAFPPSNFLGLKSLRLHLWRERYQLIPDQINGFLPYMSMLRTVDLVFNKGSLPLQLPASLQSLSYYLERYWGPGDLERFADTCRLPHLQSINLVH